jgi:Tfp pilus assembly protein PilF
MRTPILLKVCCAFSLTAAASNDASLLKDDQIAAAYVKSYHYEKVQNYADAITAIAPIFTADPKSYIVNLRLGWLCYLSGDSTNSKSHYQAAMIAAPGSLEAKLGYLLPLLAEKHYDDAEVIAKQVIQVDASNYYANLRLAFAMRMEKKNDAAEEVLKHVLMLYPSDVNGLTELGLVKVAQNQFSTAQRIFADVLTLDTENAVAKMQLAGIAKLNESKQ